MSEIDIERIRGAHSRILGHTHRTPVLTSRRLDDMAGARFFFKCENFQKTGSFKARGALNAVLSLDETDAARGVATHSSGNHGAALSWAAGIRGIPAHVVMPRTASPFKMDAVRRYGGRVVLCEPTHRDREVAAQRILSETGAALVHPFDDPIVMSGQGTAALELLEDTPDLDAIVCPVGGGGLLAATAVVAKALRPQIRIFAGEPEGAADASLSFASGVRQAVESPSSIADGLLATVGVRTFPIIMRHVDGIATVSDGEIAAAARSLLEVMKIAVEPSGAAGYAAASGGRLKLAGGRIGVILSGGNVDLGRTAWAK